MLVLVDKAPVFVFASKLSLPEAPEYPDEELAVSMRDAGVDPDWFAAGSVNAAEAIPAVSDPEIEVEAAVPPSQ